MSELWLKICLRLRADEGASVIEYALLLALIAVVCIAGVTFFGQATSDSYSSSTSSLFLGN